MDHLGFYRIAIPETLWSALQLRPWGLMLLLGMLVGTTASAAPANKEEKEPPPAPQEISLEAGDGVKISAVYYEGTEGEKTVPVIVIHDWEEKATDYTSLAEYLQNHGYAVILPDLRGHGDSTLKTFPPSQSKALTPRNVDPRNIVAGDLEAVRKFLLKENNERKLNLKATCVVGVGSGAILAAHYALLDWDPSIQTVPINWLPAGNSVRGKLKRFKDDRSGTKDVKALVLVSPERKLKTFKLDALWNHREVGTSSISTLILFGKKKQTSDKIAKLEKNLAKEKKGTPKHAELTKQLEKQKTIEGKQSKESREEKTAKIIYQKLSKNHITKAKDQDDAKKSPGKTTNVRKQTLFLKSLDTSLNGQPLVVNTEVKPDARTVIRLLLDIRLRDRLRDPELTWEERETSN